MSLMPGRGPPAVSRSLWDGGRATPSMASVGGTTTGVGWRRRGFGHGESPAGAGERTTLSDAPWCRAFTPARAAARTATCS
jgi:hypothetical protein